MIKVLQFPVANSKGGITRYVLQNWRFIDRDCFRFDFATMSKQLDFEDQLIKDGCKVFHISSYAEDNSETFTKEFREILANEQYDIIHIHTKQWKSFLVEQLAKEAGIKKIIVHAHSTGIDVLDEQKRLMEVELHNKRKAELNEDIATDYWACSMKAAEFIYGDMIPKEKIRIMNNAIDLDKFRYAETTRRECRRELGIKDKDYVVGNVGRFVYPKNQSFLLCVFKELCKQDDSFKLLLVGSGEREEEYRKYVRENNLEENVIFTGYRTDVSRLMQAMDVFCLPSHFEGLGIVLIEAQALGLQCITSDCIIEEALVTNIINRISLKSELEWVLQIEKCRKRILKNRKVYNRIVKEKGYDLREQIKYIELLYKNGTINYL